MPLPVKTQILNACKAAIEEVADIQRVIRNPSNPPQRETSKFPLVHLWDETETVVPRNRIAVCTFPLQVEVWAEVHEDGMSDAVDVLMADVQKALLSNTALFRLLIAPGIVPDPQMSSDKAYIDEFLGGLVMRFIITYAHVWGDPYSISRT